MNIIFPDQLSISPEHKKKIESLGNLTTYDDIPDEAAVIERIKDAEIITANWVDLTKNIIENSPKLRYVIVPAVGYEWIDVKTCTERGIKVINCPTHNTYAVAELTLGLMFAVARNIVEGQISLQQKQWRPFELKGVELKDRKVLLIGNGNIGSKTRKLLESIGMNVEIADSKTTDEELENMIPNADFIVLNIPLNEKTKHMIDARKLALMKKSAYLINTARGAVVDQSALLACLKEKRIAGAALDVFEDEPMKGEPTNEMLELAMLPNVVTTPHIGFNTQETEFRLGLELIENIESCINGSPLHTVN